MLSQQISSDVCLLPGLFQQRFDLARAYATQLTEDGLLQNFELEAGVRKWFHFHSDADFQKGHWGWESPTSMVRGQFLGCWMMAAARFSKLTGDPILQLKLDSIVRRLGLCQERNGGEWLGSFPEKYLHWLAQGNSPWVPHYVIHKTLLGLRESYVQEGNEAALEIEKKFVKWLFRWFSSLEPSCREEILDVETGGMLEELASLYEITHDAEHLKLSRLYSRERFFSELLRGDDALTNRHANTTLAEVLGAARMYEVTGEKRWRDITEAYWKCAVTERGTFATGGQNSGEIWCPPHEFAARLGDKNQEHCTVYHMIRLADYLFRWTGESSYLDYIEKNLYNGILAAQNRTSGMVTYYLPLAAGSRKKWGHPTRDFWCCHGTLVQAHSYYPSLIYYGAENGLQVAQYIPSRIDYSFKGSNIRLTQDWAVTQGVTAIDNASAAGERHRPTACSVRIKIECDKSVEWTLSLRIPAWIASQALLKENGKSFPIQPDERGFFDIRRTWERTEFVVVFPKEIVLSPIPDEPEMVAFMEGPIVFAGLTDEERLIHMDADNPSAFFTPENERQWGQWFDTFRLKGQERGLHFKPLYEIQDEPYTVYFPVQKRT